MANRKRRASEPDRVRQRNHLREGGVLERVDDDVTVGVGTNFGLSGPAVSVTVTFHPAVTGRTAQVAGSTSSTAATRLAVRGPRDSARRCNQVASSPSAELSVM